MTPWGLTLEDQQRWREARLGYNAWRKALEQRGYLVLQFGGVALEEARAFSLSADRLPVVAVSSRDAYAGRSFTLFHELGHLLAGEDGVCDEAEGRAEEVRCNAFAGAVLVPARALLDHPLVADAPGPAWSDDTLRKLGRDFAVSEEVVLRRLLALGRTSADFYRRKRGEYLARQAARDAEASDGGPRLPVRVVARFGRGFVRRVLLALENDRISASTAAGILEARVKHFDELQRLAHT